MFFLLSLIIPIPTFISLLNQWYFSMHDFQHIARLFLLDQGIHQGYLFPRWVNLLGFNFGYPLFNFYPPLIYYISEVFRLLGASYIWSIKAMIMLGYCLGAVGTYLLCLKVYKVHKVQKIAALVAATLFTFFTYHATLVYVRGAFAEFFGMNILPFAFLSLELLKEKPTIKRAMFFAVTLALLILSHVFVAFPFVLFCAIYVLCSTFHVSKRFEYLVHVALGGALGLCLAAFYWLPSMLERKFTLVDSILTKELASYTVHFVQPMQLWHSTWGYGGSGPGLSDGMSFQLGKIHIGLAVLSFVLFVLLAVKKKLNTEYRIRYTVYLSMLLLSLFMTTEYSKFIWDAVTPLQYLQFPWRFLTFAGVFIAILGGFVVQHISQLLDKIKNKAVVVWVIGLCIMFGTAYQYQKYFRPESYVKKVDAELTSFNEIAWNVSSSSFEFSPKGAPLKKSRYDTSIFDIEVYGIRYTVYGIRDKKAVVKVVKNDFNNKSFYIEASKSTTFTLNTFNFPGWTAYIDGGRLPISDNNKYKLITVQVASGVHNLEFRFEDTPVRKLSNAVSLVSLMGTVLLLSVCQFKKSKG